MPKRPNSMRHLDDAIRRASGGTADGYVRMIKDMNDEELNANTRPTDCKKQARYIRGYINDLQMEVPVIMTPEDEEALESSKDEEA